MIALCQNPDLPQVYFPFEAEAKNRDQRKDKDETDQNEVLHSTLLDTLIVLIPKKSALMWD